MPSPAVGCDTAKDTTWHFHHQEAIPLRDLRLTHSWLRHSDWCVQVASLPALFGFVVRDEETFMLADATSLCR